MRLHIQLEVGDGVTRPSDDVVNDINNLIKDLGEVFRLG